MELVTPDLGLLFWTGLVFLCLLFLLVKFAWKPILGAVNTREQNISSALELAEKTKEEMKKLGWEPSIKLTQRIKQVVEWSLKNENWIEL